MKIWWDCWTVQETSGWHHMHYFTLVGYFDLSNPSEAIHAKRSEQQPPVNGISDSRNWFKLTILIILVWQLDLCIKYCRHTCWQPPSPILLVSSPVSAGVLCFSELFFMKEPHDVTVMRRDAVILDCQAHGESPIDVRWLKNGVEVLENERLYLLSTSEI